MRVGVNSSINLKNLLAGNVVDKAVTYSIVAAVNHYGKSAASGHYESLLFAPNGDSFRCNDSTTTKVDTERLFKSTRFQKGNRLLLYMRNSKPSKTLPTSEPGPWRTLSCDEMGRIE